MPSLASSTSTKAKISASQVASRGLSSVQRLVTGDAAVIGRDAAAEQHHPPVGGQAEQEQQDVGGPRADAAGPVGDAVDLGGVRPARVVPAVADERHQQENAERNLQDPADFGEEARHAMRQCLRARGIRSFCH